MSVSLFLIILGLLGVLSVIVSGEFRLQTGKNLTGPANKYFVHTVQNILNHMDVQKSKTKRGAPLIKDLFLKIKLWFSKNALTNFINGRRGEVKKPDRPSSEFLNNVAEKKKESVEDITQRRDSHLDF